ncbi:xanthine dehydrogenase family protein molybdopterin-binding subunit [Jannaschia ovalis]|uniref:Molybdopterin-dependent oxidoreductase n=1 Tax=Jannaschia ovalis TaxID=3038773 RepID=A0ABY8LEF1_9RHOB|nr:molybdopterin cofactor-binding domain-containing protein [Jannaschia sp. GRR-S6-38]WGH79672.1 molybdopterin-dependent oxidoreductase [Jannaschia sp. GRR-S6-38]
MGRAATLARRTFLIGSAAIAGGVAFGVWAYKREGENPLLADLPDGASALTPYVLIDAEGVTLITPRAEVGQGATSIQAYLLAEELDVDPLSVRTAPGPASAAYWNGEVAAEGFPFAAWDDGFVARTSRAAGGVAGKLVGLNVTGGSTTVPDAYDKLRAAGASARETLKQAAADRLGLSRADLRTENGAVIPPEGDPIPYTALAADAAALDPVEAETRDPADWRWLGKPHRRIDIVAKATGTERYGIDLDLPDMLHATAVTNPAHGKGVTAMDASEAEAMRGVLAVHLITGGAAVVADNTWRAIRAANAIRFEWEPPATTHDTDAFWALHAAALTEDTRDSRFADDGDVEAATGDAFQADYGAPFLHHAPLEPANATIRYTPERTDIWTATQVPPFAVDAVARVLEQDADRVRLHNQTSGGSFGHRLELLWIQQAAEIARHHPGRPVKMTWSREEDMASGFLRPMAVARGRGTTGEGRVRSLDLAIAAQSVTESQMSRLGFPPIGPDTAIVAAAWDAPYALADRRVTGHRVPATVPVSSWRSVGASHNGFFVETLMDELIHQAGADPVAERLRLIHHAPSRAVLETVAEMAAWDGPRPGPGRGRGVAFTFAFGVPCAQIVDVVDGPDGLRITDLWVAAEVGRVLDPVNLEAQLSGGALFGLGHAMQAEIPFEDGLPVPRNFDLYESLRMWQVPRVHVRALGTTGAIRGAGEPGLPPAAPALGNAIFAATGQRIRRMPFAREIRFA